MGNEHWAGAALPLALACALIAGGIVEAWLHRRRLQRIPIRIHVNGTRGKSSVVRLIAAGLRAGGIKTWAKTTGTAPEVILPDGREHEVFRPGPPNVIEQVRLIAQAVRSRPQAIVVECMALNPALQRLCEDKMVQATHGVITNVRADHLDVMGPGRDDVARALATTTPRRGKLFTAERRRLRVLAEAAAARGSDLIAVGPEDIRSVTPLDLSLFPYVEHAENVALALRVCSELGVPRSKALQGMWRTAPDPGAMTIHELDFYGRRIAFVNGFAANDPESTRRVWDLSLERYPEAATRIAIINCREDRPERSEQIGAACVGWSPADHYVVIGDRVYPFVRAAVAAGLPAAKIRLAEGAAVAEVFETVIELTRRSSLVVGMANIGGVGLELVHYFSHREKPRGGA